MRADAPQAARDYWCDGEGIRIALFCWVEQVVEHPEHGVQFSRLHQQGQFLGRGPDVLYVRFASEGQLISVPPELLRCSPTNRMNAGGDHAKITGVRMVCA
jgi:hypothetical protein